MTINRKDLKLRGEFYYFNQDKSYNVSEAFNVYANGGNLEQGATSYEVFLTSKYSSVEKFKYYLKKLVKSVKFKEFSEQEAE